MNKTLLDEFFSEDASTYIKGKLLEAIQKGKTNDSLAVREFTFNRFNVILNFQAREVILQDDLKMGPEDEYKLSIEKFEIILLATKH